MVAVVTDSAANLPGETARELRIGIVPMYLKLGDQVYRDGADLTPRDFYTRLAAGEEAASTSTPSRPPQKTNTLAPRSAATSIANITF